MNPFWIWIILWICGEVLYLWILYITWSKCIHLQINIKSTLKIIKVRRNITGPFGLRERKSEKRKLRKPIYELWLMLVYIHVLVFAILFLFSFFPSNQTEPICLWGTCGAHKVCSPLPIKFSSYAWVKNWTSDYMLKRTKFFTTWTDSLLY
jgi:hypothetical protein